MCMHTIEEENVKKVNRNRRVFGYYTFAILFAILSATLNVAWLHSLATVIADMFVNMFKCISLPIIASSIIVTLVQYNNSDVAMSSVWRRTILYTFTTTIVAASIACGLYLIINPASVIAIAPVSDAVMNIANANNYFSFVVGLIPTNFLAPFIEQQVFSVLLLGLLIGIATRNIKNQEAKSTCINFLKGIHEVLLSITSWIVKIVPIGMYGFITVTILQLKNGIAISGLWSYLAIIVLANLVQGFVILPLWLYVNGLKPWATMRAMLPALSLAFFTKSSAGTLPVTIETIEKNLKVDNKISRFVLPLCTTINMNGCAAFIFVTVMYLMQINGTVLSLQTMLVWVVISTVAAVGNAGIPMGCFFLSASLLASMNVPISVLGLILPLYSLIDMLETAINVWSDACITTVVDHKIRANEVVGIPAIN